jgi:hypothetical protein
MQNKEKEKAGESGKKGRETRADEENREEEIEMKGHREE